MEPGENSTFNVGFPASWSLKRARPGASVRSVLLRGALVSHGPMHNAREQVGSRR